MACFETNSGVKLFYEKSGEGRPIIFVHPPLMGHVVFRYQQELSRGHQVIFYDCRGHGQSTYNKPEDVIETHVADLRELILHLKLEKPIVAGYSNGGEIALSYALAYPNDIGALILSGGYPKVSTWVLQQEYNAGIWLMKRDMKGFLSGVLAKTHKVTESDERLLYDYMLKARTEAVLELYEAGKAFDVLADLAKIKELPTLVLYGTKSNYINKYCKIFEAHLPKAQIAFIDGGTHQLPTRYHKPFNSVITEFLKGPGPGL
ncbi:pimeloyl-ACP methyl ester carboxylesterase [Scopulibacillus darangshiensis]|uniref:Pimeloyl-ACP methyl ester carboxylesterase n=1 Tax=Scopulibacillus darangshiensis TaxID=442528 RepID=A0A4R2NN01_9BACL|nr:alpha/beta hydrolase [Scopulibacillus darangshiensis]TCP23017.1 pimeloyl-ACP methyl ester carboxylesterase [Scopulibacillus darangshiensis]